MKVCFSETLTVFVFIILRFPEVGLLVLSPQMVGELWVGPLFVARHHVSIPSLAIVFIFLSFVNLIGQNGI
jgi:hypothetical protein